MDKKLKTELLVPSESTLLNPYFLSQEEIDRTPSSSVLDIDYNKYKDYLSQDGQPVSDAPETWDEKRALRQSSFDKIKNTLGQGAGTFGTALLSGYATLGALPIALGAEAYDAAFLEGDQVSGMDILLNNSVSKGLNELDKYIKEEIFPTYYTQEQQEKLFSASLGTELVNGLGFALSAMYGGGPNIINKVFGGLGKVVSQAKLGKLTGSLDEMVAAGKITTQEAAKIGAIAKPFEKMGNITGALVGRAGESAMEAYDTYEKVKQNLEQESKLAKQELETYGITNKKIYTSEEIEEKAKEQRNNVFFGNELLGASDLLQKTRWLNKGSIADDIIKQGSKFAIKPKTFSNKITSLLGEGAQEAGEEGFQFLLQKGAEKAAKDGNFFMGLMQSTDELFTTVEGQKSMLLGALLGGGMSTAFNAMNKKQKNEFLNSKVDELNSNPTFKDRYIINSEGQRVVNPEFVNSTNTFIFYEKQKEQAKLDNDQEAYDLAEKLQFSNLIASRKKADMLDNFIDELEVLGKSSPAEIKAMFGEIPKNEFGDEMTPSEISKKYINEAKQISKMIDSIDAIPQFTNISLQDKDVITETLIHQDSLLKSYKDLQIKVNELSLSENPLDLSRAQTLRNKADVVEKEYKKNVDLLNSFLAKPEIVKQKAEEKNNKKIKKEEIAIEQQVRDFNEADNVIENAIKNDKPIIIKNADGTTKTVTYQDGNYVEQDGIFVEETEVKQGVINELNEQNSADVIDNDIDDVEESTINYSIKKPNIHSSSTQGHNFKKNSDGTIDRTEKQKETTVAGKIIYQLNGLFKRFVDYSSKALNTPLVRKATSEPTTYSFVATIGEVTDEELNSINSDRAFFAKENNVSLPPVTREDLMSNPAFIPISLQLQANGKNVGGAVTRMHNPDYIYRTQEFDAIMENENIVDKQGAIDSLLEQYTTYRKQLIDKIKTGQKVNLLVDTKSGGIMNVTPMIDGKMQVNPITDTFKHINEYESGLYIDNVQLMPNGIGVVTEIDEKGNGVIEFSNGNKGIVANANLGEMIFQTIDAGANIVNIRALSKNKLSDEQLNNLVDLIYYKLSTGENTITVNGKEQTIVGNQSVGRGIVDSLILIAARQNKEKQIFFKKNGSLVVGRKEFTFEDSPEVVKQAIYETLLAGNNEVNFKKDIKPDSDFMLPALIDGEWKGKTTTYNDYIFGGENPLIGTFVDSETPFINSYYGYKMDENGYVTEPIEETKLEPIYVTDVDFDDEGRAMPTYSTEPEVKVVTDVKGDIEQQKQKQLENRVKELENQRKALRSEDGSIPTDKMSEFKRLGEEINKAKRVAQRGNSVSSMLIKKFPEGADTSVTDPETLSAEDKKEAANIIEQVIQNSKTAEEALKKIQRLDYIFDIAVTQNLNSYLEDRFNPNAPRIGNNKDSFQAWIYGKTDSELAVLESKVVTPVQKTNIEKRINDTISKVFGSESLFNFDTNQPGKIVEGEFIPDNLGSQIFEAMNKTLKGEVVQTNKIEAGKLFKEYAKTVHPDKNTQSEERQIIAEAFFKAMQTAKEQGRVDILNELKTKFDTELAALESKPETVDNSEIIKIQENMKQDADESISDCNGKTPALPDGKNLSGKANKYKKK